MERNLIIAGLEMAMKQLSFLEKRIKENSKEADELEILHLLTPTEIVEVTKGSEAEIPVLDNLK